MIPELLLYNDSIGAKKSCLQHMCRIKLAITATDQISLCHGIHYLILQKGVKEHKYVSALVRK